ncbi:MAG: EAL and HDOD domain-containing protein [Desulfovibrio sp.]
MNDATHSAKTFLARQPIFDATLNTWGYMLLFRACGEDTCAIIDDPFGATAQVLATLPMITDRLPEDVRAMVRFPAKAIHEDMSAALRPESTAMIMAQLACVSQEDFSILARMKKEGFLVAVDDVSPNCEIGELMRMADILVLDFAAQSEEELRALARVAVRGGLTLMAKKVETRGAMELARELGVNLFHGYFYQQPDIHEGRKLCSAKAARMRLFALLGQVEPDFDAIAMAIEPDPIISFRLLNFLNSPHFGFARTISSVRQAIVLAGWQKVRNWLRLILLTDIAPQDKTSELLYLSAQRGRFLELLAEAASRKKMGGSLFLVGLFSLLDALLDMPMPEVLQLVHLTPEVNAALRGEESPFSPWLSLVRTIENGDWDAMGHLALNLGLPTGSVSETYVQSLEWADGFFKTTSA